MSAIDDLVGELARLPGIGRKTASRLTFHLMKRSPQDIRRLAAALTVVSERVAACNVCGNLTESQPCHVCTNPKRDAGCICVVEEASDIVAIEAAGAYLGLYHVLGGRIAPLDGIGPAELHVSSLMERLGNGADVREVIVATNPSVEGEATALYLQKLIHPLGVRVTRLARGLPVGGDLEYVDCVTIAEAIAGRKEI